MTYLTGEALLARLNDLLAYEMTAMVRYLHHSFMVFGPNRFGIRDYYRTQATEAMTHATMLGEKITALGGHPTTLVHPVEDPGVHTWEQMFQENLQSEREALRKYQDLLPLIDPADVALEDLIRSIIIEETAHIEDIEKLLRRPE
ncbi:MAG: hypothetical protein GEEBNDBF_00739 [bacterium]|nr:hypothetical protein [bacterium]